jgi:23S rRNA (guanosine2251-2'-O)-methyltransferase
VYQKLLTIYGRKPVIEALEDNSLEIFKLHLSNSNKQTKEIKKILSLAKKRQIPIIYYSKRELSFISKNSKQDQGVALDIKMKNFLLEEEFLKEKKSFRVLAVDKVTNPQNLGLIIRSATAGNIDALIISQGSAPIASPLTIKASTGTIFKLPIIKSKNLLETLKNFKKENSTIFTLSSHAKESYKNINYPLKSIFVLGNETFGVSEEIEEISDKKILIPMNRGVESLNVAMSATLIAFLD